MSDEEKGWYHLASHLGMAVQEVQLKTTATEYSKWMVFLAEERKWKEERIDKQDIYLAQIALEACRSRIKKPGDVKLEDFILGDLPKTKKASKPKTKKEAAERMKKQMFSALGNPKGFE